MHALIARRGADPAVPQHIQTDIPEPGAGQVRIKVAAAAVNPVDLVTATGALADFGIAADRAQYGLGWDVAGTIDAIGPGVDSAGDLAVGKPVIGLSDQLAPPLKTHAEYVVLTADAITAAPRGVDPVAASTLGLNALVAMQALETLGLTEGQTLLVTGAAGAYGGYAVELGRKRGLTVVAVAGPDDRELVTGLGADVFIPRSDDLDAAVRAVLPEGVDGAVDAAALGIATLEAVRSRRGRYVAATGGAVPPPLRGISVHEVHVGVDAEQLAELVRLVESGDLTLRVAETYPLAEAATAYARLAKGGVRGRLVLIP